MAPPTLPSGLVRFDGFEVDIDAAELTKNGRKARIQGQPLRVLAMLLERPGEVVSREEMRQKLWPADTFVDFDHGLNSAVARLREALNDSREEPKYIETIPRRGYRFIGSLDQADSPDPAQGGSAHPSPKVPSRQAAIILVTSFLTLLIVAATLALFRNRQDSSTAPPEVIPLAGLAGFEQGPAFSPDGKQVAFREIDGPDSSGIYTASVGGERALQLTKDSRDCCSAWSPDGRQIAFLRQFDDVMSVYVVPVLGGTERKLYTLPSAPYPSLDWSPDGKFLVFPQRDSKNFRTTLTLFSLADSATRQLTSPPDESRDDNAVFSPDGSKVIFVRGTIAGVVNDLYVIPTVGGEPTRLTFDNVPLYGVSWTPDGQELVFSSQRGGLTSLWRVPLSGGSPQPLTGIGSMAASPSIARVGNLMAYQQVARRDNIRRISLADEKHFFGTPTVPVATKGKKLRPDISRDGKRIAFESDRLGNAEIWACDIDGANCAQLTSLHGTAGSARWSPDGRYLAFEFHPGEHAEVYVLEVPGGTPRLVSTIPGADNLVPSWSRDGQWIYFTSKERGTPFQLWKVPITGGPPVQITKTGGLAAVESADGRFLYYVKYELGGIWRMPLSGGDEVCVFDQLASNDRFSWSLAAHGIYFLSDSGPHKTTVNYLEFDNKKILPVVNLDKPTGWGLSISPDGKSLFYVEVEFDESTIMVVKNFH